MALHRKKGFEPLGFIRTLTGKNCKFDLDVVISLRWVTEKKKKNKFHDIISIKIMLDLKFEMLSKNIAI